MQFIRVNYISFWNLILIIFVFFLATTIDIRQDHLLTEDTPVQVPTEVEQELEEEVQLEDTQRQMDHRVTSGVEIIPTITTRVTGDQTKTTGVTTTEDLLHQTLIPSAPSLPPTAILFINRL